MQLTYDYRMRMVDEQVARLNEQHKKNVDAGWKEVLSEDGLNMIHSNVVTGETFTAPLPVKAHVTGAKASTTSQFAPPPGSVPAPAEAAATSDPEMIKREIGYLQHEKATLIGQLKPNAVVTRGGSFDKPATKQAYLSDQERSELQKKIADLDAKIKYYSNQQYSKAPTSGLPQM
jgi:hypothetical protein